jgi:hypothetical protein
MLNQGFRAPAPASRQPAGDALSACHPPDAGRISVRRASRQNRPAKSIVMAECPAGGENFGTRMEWREKRACPRSTQAQSLSLAFLGRSCYNRCVTRTGVTCYELAARGGP